MEFETRLFYSLFILMNEHVIQCNSVAHRCVFSSFLANGALWYRGKRISSLLVLVLSWEFLWGNREYHQTYPVICVHLLQIEYNRCALYVH